MSAAHDDEMRDGVLDAVFVLGVNFLIQGQYEKALIIFDGLMALYPEHCLVATAYGESLLMAGRIEEAYHHFLSLLKRFAPDGKILLGAARAAVLLGKHEEVHTYLFPLIEKEVQVSPPDLNTARSMFLAISAELKMATN